MEPPKQGIGFLLTFCGTVRIRPHTIDDHFPSRIVSCVLCHLESPSDPKANGGMSQNKGVMDQLFKGRGDSGFLFLGVSLVLPLIQHSEEDMSPVNESTRRLQNIKRGETY